jgi:hypothetical protein
MKPAVDHAARGSHDAPCSSNRAKKASIYSSTTA